MLLRGHQSLCYLVDIWATDDKLKWILEQNKCPGREKFLKDFFYSKPWKYYQLEHQYNLLDLFSEVYPDLRSCFFYCRQDFFRLTKEEMETIIASNKDMCCTWSSIANVPSDSIVSFNAAAKKKGVEGSLLQSTSSVFVNHSIDDDESFSFDFDDF